LGNRFLPDIPAKAGIHFAVAVWLIAVVLSFPRRQESNAATVRQEMEPGARRDDERKERGDLIAGMK
jgi:hypothetical protein